MKHLRIEQYATILEDSAELFDEALNAAIIRLKDHNPIVKRSEANPLYASVKYFIEYDKPESITDEYEAVGVRLVCGQCPFFKPMLKEDGAEDKRCKHGDCEHAEMKRTKKTTPACDKLYELIHEGSVKLCFAE